MNLSGKSAASLARTATLFATILALSACSIEDKTNSNSGVSEEKYNSLVREYNSAIGTSIRLQGGATQLNIKLRRLNAAVSNFNEAIKKYETLDLGSCNSMGIEIVKTTYNLTVDSVRSLEVEAFDQYDRLIKNAESVYVTPQSAQLLLTTQKQAFENEGKALNGIRNLVINAYNQFLNVQNLKEPNCAISPLESPVALAAVEKKVELTAEEVELSKVNSNGGFYREDNKIVVLNSREGVVGRAISLGLNSDAAGNSFTISQSTGGVVGLARGSDELAQTIQDMFGHIKSQINSNTDDLEVVFAIDYSGSMSDDIKNVIRNLAAITQSLVAVQKSGRNVKIGISTFGLIGKESINLDLTSDLTQVSRTLVALDGAYATAQHSDDPGEGSYSGLRLTANKMSWSSKNRKIIMITDEPSKEMEMGMTSVIGEAQKALKANGIQTSIYTIVVGN